MQAIVQKRYGEPSEVLQVEDVAIPQLQSDEVLVRVQATSLHPDVWHVVTGRPYVLRLLGAGVIKPKNPVPGTDLAGRVEAVGQAVTAFRPGDEVFGESHRKMQWNNGGAFAEYVAAPQEALAHKPTTVSFEQAASLPTSGYIALMNLQAVDLQPGKRVLVNGAGGGVGSIAVQFAKARGAHVTAVDSSPKLDMLRSLGADQVIDFTRQDFTRQGERYDLVFDVASNLSLSKCKHVLTPQGIYLLIGHDHYGQAQGRILGSLPRFLKQMLLLPFVNHLPKPTLSMPTKKEVLSSLRELLESGALTPFVDRTFPLNEVAAAMRYLQEGQPRGKVILTP